MKRSGIFLRVLVAITTGVVGLTAQAGETLFFRTQPGTEKNPVRSVDRHQIQTLSLGESRTPDLATEQNRPTSYWVVQYNGLLGEAQKRALRQKGFQVLRYVPDDAFLVKAPAPSIEAPKVGGDVRTVVAFKPELRMNSEALAGSVFTADRLERLHIRALPGEDYTALENIIGALPGTKVIDADRGGYIVDTPLKNAAVISGLEGIEWVDRYHPPQKKVFDVSDLQASSQPPAGPGRVEDLTGFESGTHIMRFEGAWRRGFNGSGEVITVADTGLDTGNAQTLSPDFRNLRRPYIGGLRSTTWGDPDGHGTHVSGSATSRGETSAGRVTGGAPGAQLVIEAMWSEEVENLTIPANPSKLFEIVYQREASRIHSNSWGSGDPKDAGLYDESSRAVDDFVFRNPDMLILFVSGNEGVDANGDGRIDPGSISTPGTAKNALTVGASENFVLQGGIQNTVGLMIGSQTGRAPGAPLANSRISDNPNGLVFFSSRGPTTDGRQKPDVVAPGSNILSNCSKFEGADEGWGQFNKDLCFMGGTSMSTPLVAGAAAVVRQYLKREKGVAQPSAALLKGVIMHTADDLFPGQYGSGGAAQGQEILVPGPNSDQGYGRVNVTAAVDSGLAVIDERVGVGTGEAKSYRLPPGTRKVTMVYSDAPASSAVGKALVNQLDLSVTVAGTALKFEKPCRIDNHAQIVIPAGITGELSLTVKGNAVPMGVSGRQPFALIASRGAATP
jgi:serine protease AprX